MHIPSPSVTNSECKLTSYISWKYCHTMKKALLLRLTWPADLSQGKAPRIVFHLLVKSQMMQNQTYASQSVGISVEAASSAFPLAVCDPRLTI